MMMSSEGSLSALPRTPDRKSTNGGNVTPSRKFLPKFCEERRTFMDMPKHDIQLCDDSFETLQLI